MKEWKLPLFGAMIGLCILINYAGRLVATSLSLPFWLDSFGTILCALSAGPVCGMLVGLTSNLVFCLTSGAGWEYALISIMIGLVIGVAARRNKLNSLFDFLTAGALIALLSMLISVPLNYLLNGGSTGQVWGDSVIGFFRDLGLPALFCLPIGQLYVELLDKIFVMLFIFGIIHEIREGRIRRLLRPGEDKQEQSRADQINPEDLRLNQSGQEMPEPDGKPEKNSRAARSLGLLIAAGLAFSGWAAGARAEEKSREINFNDYIQSVFSSQNGLPCGEANDIAQTKDGILWIGTYAGLYRYNGREFRWMSEYDSVRNVNVLYVDEEGRLWIGTNDNGLSIAINEKIVNVVDQAAGLPTNSVRSIIRSSDGYYYIGTSGSMQVLSLSYGLKRGNVLNEIQYAVHVAADENGHVAAVTEGGILYLLSEGQILSSRQMTDGKTVFKSCFFDTDGQLFAATTGSEIYVFDVRNGWFRETGVLSAGTLESIQDMIRLENGDLMITADNGIGILDAENRFSFINTNDFSNSIDKVLVDYQGNLWFASSRLGLLRLAPSDFRDIYSTTGMESKVVNAITRWNGAYYFGTDSGLDAVSPDCTHAVTNELTEQLAGSRIRCMTVDRENHLWICVYNRGVLEIAPDGQQILYDTSNGATDSRARVVIQLSDGTILVGGERGIGFIRDHRVAEIVQDVRILTLTEMPDGRLLAGTDGNGLAILEGTKVVRRVTRADGLSSEVILRTVTDPETGGVYIVTSNGLCYMDPDGSIRSLDHFPYYNNYDIWIQDPGTLHVLSSAGIFVVEREDLLSGSADLKHDLLDTRQGLSSSLTANAWTYFDEDTGELFLPCDNGVFAFHPRLDTVTARSYRLSVPMARLDGAVQQVERGSPIRIARGVSRLELYPEVVNYTIQDPFVSYKLEGFDQDWTTVAQNSLGAITYTNLPTGDYLFRMLVLDSSMQNVLAERDYALVKEMELHDSRWFILYLLTVPMFTVTWITWMLVKRRHQRIERELAEANRMVEMGKQTVAAIARAVDAKDVRTGGHSTRVALYSAQIARAYGMDEKQCREIQWAAQLHDIGKIAIPDAILNKDSRLTDEEYAVMKSHTTEGAKILKDFTLLDHVTEGAQFHHERPDGRGYPQGLSGENIPLYARIIGVADAFDAMTAARVYRKQMDFGYVLGELDKGRGTQFAPEFVDILLDLIRSGEIDLNKLYGIRLEDAEEQKDPPSSSGPGKEA